jgi:hypothetical protein
VYVSLFDVHNTQRSASTADAVAGHGNNAGGNGGGGSKRSKVAQP